MSSLTDVAATAHLATATGASLARLSSSLHGLHGGAQVLELRAGQRGSWGHAMSSGPCEPG